MKLYFIRHGETVDNVAGLYAGTKDSQLTNHGVEQTHRLGAHFARHNVRFTHIFSSPLSRAYRTAEAVRKAQRGNGGLEVVKVPELIERDFGYYEGKPFNTRADEKQAERDRKVPGFRDVESKEVMAARVDRFLDERLIPLLREDGKDELVVAVVAHGMLLAGFWRRLLVRLPRQSLVIAPEVKEKRGGAVLEYLGGWSNTGYMELAFKKAEEPREEALQSPVAASEDVGPTDATALPTPVPPRLEPGDAEVSIATPKTDEQNSSSTPLPQLLSGWSTTILAVDSTIHLLGLKRQRGGIGSLAHDDGQRKLESFFKKPRLS
ncbi:uncharacterized protein LTR77_000338 [Saxophila tyrrhenica]|uniref:Phosphoglycerate mutase n=1 Tax=Saxophila tyrrhenica TaxID=1690608 RepID=A0AAV9PN30_9PEZI|nr:hypothetical protein LTR77_000338 [Saxophila tyrrhenica]